MDVRVSTLPSGHGERVVMRILDKQAGRLHLSALGMDPKTEQRIAELFRKPHGIILVTGPTGSGKTTTLYAGLEHLNDNTQNIMTVEDPIEYYIDGIGQTQVNTKVEMTFARGLRAILRQDPDVVMVGEIRDLETAQIAVQASLTGHLVLSTLHTNTAVGALTRLRDMGIEPFLLSSSLIGVVAQRLVRTLNPDNKQPFEAGEYERRLLGLGPDDPSPRCTGQVQVARRFRGRTGIYELVIVDDQMRTMIHDEVAEHELERYARTMTPSIRDDGLERVLRGETTRRRSPARHARGLTSPHGRFRIHRTRHRGPRTEWRRSKATRSNMCAQLLRERQLLPVTVAEVRHGEAKRDRSFTVRRGVSASDLSLLTRQLATLVKAGLPLEESLLAVSQQSEKPRVQSIMLGVRAKVMEGHTLADGVAEFPKVFPEIYRSTVAAGESSGRLDGILERLADYTENREVTRQKVLGAMLYPIVLSIICLGIVTGMMVYVVPKVIEVFESSKGKLPLATQVLILVSEFLRSWGIYLALGIVAGIVGFVYWLKNPDNRRRFHRFQLRLPLFGRLVRGFNTARFTRTFSILTAQRRPRARSHAHRRRSRHQSTHA